MRKAFIFGAIALATTIVGCTKIEVVESDITSNQKSINFSAYAMKPTKAAQTDVTTENLSSFNVTAIGNSAVYFDDVTFTKATTWDSNPVYFWPAYKLNFYAYNVPGNSTTFTRDITTSGQTLAVAPATAIADQEDLVAAYAADKTDPSGATALTFNHYLTQVVVNAKKSNDTYAVSVEGIKLANMAGDGTFTFSDGKMTATAGKVNTATSTDYSETFTAKTLTSTATEVMTTAGTGKWYLIPQAVTAWDQTNEKTNASNGTYLALKVKITANSGATKIYPASGDDAAWMAVPVPAELAFAQGKKYTVTVDFFSSTGKGAGYVDPETPGELDGDSTTTDAGKPIIGGVIKFDATVNAWDNTVDVTISL